MYKKIAYLRSASVYVEKSMANLVSTIFRYFSKNKPLGKYEKCFLFQLKWSFYDQDNQIFIAFFFHVQHFKILRGNRKLNDCGLMKWAALIINCISLNN